MKRLFAIVMAAVMLFSIPAFAADLDLSGMTTEELVALQDSIQTELNSRGYNKNDEIATGVFVVGQDIRAGIFSYEAIEDTTLFVYENSEKYNSREPLSTILIFKGQNGTISLADNQVMEIVSGRGRLSDDKPSWAP